MGSLTGGSSKSKTSSSEKFDENMTGNAAFNRGSAGVSTQNPWEAQIPFLMEAFNAAQGAFKGAPTSFDGPAYAGPTELQKQATGAGTQALNAGGSIIDQLLGAGSTGVQGGQASVANARDLISRALGDNTQKTIDAAGQYAKNPYTDQMVDAASRDVTRNLKENTLPGITKSAIGTGNIGSSKTFIKQGIAERAAGDRIADIGAGIRGNAYSQGLDLANNQGQAGMQQALNANAQLGQAGQAGQAALTGANTLGFGNASSAYGLGAAGQAEQNAGIQANLERAMLNAGLPMANVQQLMSVIGGTGYGGTTTNLGGEAGTETQQSKTAGTRSGNSTSKGTQFGFGLSL